MLLHIKSYKMKKIFGLIAVVAVVFALTLTVNTSNEQTEGLSDVIAYNIADAQEVAVRDIVPVAGCRFTGNSSDRCTKPGLIVTNCVNSMFTTCGIDVPVLAVN
jgi:hypothetical protein